MQNIDSSYQIKIGAVISYITIGFSILSGLIYTPWMIRVIGQESYGLYTLALSLISMFLIDFGISSAVARFISKYNAEDDKQSVDNILGIVYKLYLIIDLVVIIALVIVYFFIDTIYAKLTPVEIISFKVVYIIGAIFSVMSFPFTTLNGILTAYEQFISLKACDMLNRVLTVAFTIVALLLGYDLYALVAVNAICGLVTIIIKLMIIKKKTTLKVNFKFKSKVMLKDIFSFSIWSSVISIAERLIFNITPSILGAISSSISIAMFGIASTLEGYVFIFANAINGMFLPRVSRMVARENSDENVLQLMIKIGRIQLAIVGLIVIGFISVGKEFIVAWMGESYTISYYCTIVLILPSIITLPQEIANITIVALNKVKLKSYVFIVTSVINIILSIKFSQIWGAFGSSLAICISSFFRCVAMNVIYYTVLNIDVFKFFKECHIKMSVPLLFSLLFGLGVSLLINVTGWIGLLIKGGILVLAYVIIMWFKCFNKFEKDFVFGIFSCFVKKIKHSA